MSAADWLVLVLYFVGMALIGLWAMRGIKAQEDFFLGGRSFGKLLQMFAAFGAGTGSSDPVNTARTTFTSGMSGMWSVMSWLFATPFYWIASVWFRRMRHLTTGDWFVERYESQALGAAYTLFGLLFYVVYSAMLFTAIGKFAAPLMGDTILVGDASIGVEYILVPVIALIVATYGVLGGLKAAYWTDLIQGLFVILLSILLIPFGLNMLVERFGDPANQSLLEGFRIMHEQVPEVWFDIFGSTAASEFPIYRIVAVGVTLLVGVVVLPHFIATGGGSAKTETNARIGLVGGNLAKRFCTIGWALTALIVLALFADRAELIEDPDKTWGVATLELLGPGLRGLMVACMLAALMSSVDCYMLVGSALVVRNIYAAYINPVASEAKYVMAGRIAGVIIIVGAVLFSWCLMDVFRQLQLTWIVPMIFAAPFWLGLYWRRATTIAAWGSVGYALLVFFVVPWFTPLMVPGLCTSPDHTITNHIVTTTLIRKAAPSDVRQRQAARLAWQQQPSGPEPEPLQLGDPISDTFTTGGQPIYWSGEVVPEGELKYEVVREEEDDGKRITVKRYACPLRASGNFNLDFIAYNWLGFDLSSASDAMLATLELPPKIITPFLVMIVLSLVTPRNNKAVLDRYYVKMKTPVEPDQERDRAELQRSFANPGRFDEKRLIPFWGLEIQKPALIDIVGFLATFGLCFFVVYLAVWLVSIGS